jgi:hypothetical protein
MDNHQDLIDLIKSTPAIEPPDHLTPRVMATVMQEASEGRQARAWHFLSMSREFTQNPISAFRAGIDNMELVWHFFIAGFVYAIIGTLLLIGFSEFTQVTALSEWISLQPFLWLASALMFVFCGGVLYAGGNRGLQLVRSYVFFHIGFVIVNGIFISLSSALPLTIVFTVLFAMPVIIIGITLFISNDKTRKFLTKGEIFSHAVQEKA